jgi:hypothetical protein
LVGGLVDCGWFGWLVWLVVWLVWFDGRLVVDWFDWLVGWFLVGCIHNRPSIKFDASYHVLLQQS